MRRKRRLKRKIKKNIALYIIEFVLIIVIIFSAIKVGMWLHNDYKNKEIAKTISSSITVINDKKEEIEDEKKYSVDFKSLKEKNPDVVGWLKVNGTNIEYVIVKSNDNSYYLKHNFDKSYNVFGWIFANYNNKFDGSDKNITIFGHNMTDGSMFGTLKNTLTSDWQNNEDNLKITFITENEYSIYQVFSTYKVLDELYFFTSNFNNDNDYLNFLNTIKSRSNHDYGIELSADDSILTLSTCDTNNKYRVILHAKKIKEK